MWRIACWPGSSNLAVNEAEYFLFCFNCSFVNLSLSHYEDYNWTVLQSIISKQLPQLQATGSLRLLRRIFFSAGKSSKLDNLSAFLPGARLNRRGPAVEAGMDCKWGWNILKNFDILFQTRLGREFTGHYKTVIGQLVFQNIEDIYWSWTGKVAPATASPVWHIILLIWSTLYTH